MINHVNDLIVRAIFFVLITKQKRTWTKYPFNALPAHYKDVRIFDSCGQKGYGYFYAK